MVKESISVCVALPIRHVVRRPTSGKWGMGFGPGSWRAIKAVAMYSPPQRWLAIAVARYILYIPSPSHTFRYPVMGPGRFSSGCRLQHCLPCPVQVGKTVGKSNISVDLGTEELKCQTRFKV